MSEELSLESGIVPQKRLLSFLLPNKIYPIPSDAERKPFPEENAGIISRAFFWWLFPILKVGYGRTLTDKDLYYLPDNMKVEHFIAIFDEILEREIKHAKEKHIRKKAQKAKKAKEVAKEITEKEVTKNEITENEITENEITGNEITGNEITDIEITDKEITNKEISPKDISTTTATSEDPLADFYFSKWNLFFVLFLTFRPKLILSGIFSLIALLLIAFTPLLTKHLTEFVQDRAQGNDVHIGVGVGYAIGVTLFLFFGGMTINHAFQISFVTGNRCKSVLTHFILQKSFKLNAASRHKYPSSKITSLLTTDLSRVELAMSYQPLLWTLPVPFVIAIVILVTNIGVAAVVGIAVFLIFLVAIGISTQKLYEYRDRVSKLTDNRVKLIKELIQNLKIIKFYSWELPYFANIFIARSKEITVILKIQRLRNVIFAITSTLSGISAMISFLVVYGIHRTTKDAASSFSSISTFEILAIVIFLLPTALSFTADMLMGLKRIADYLFSPEIEGMEYYHQLDDPLSPIALEIAGGFFEWETFEPEEDEEEKKKKDKVEKENLKLIWDTLTKEEKKAKKLQNKQKKKDEKMKKKEKKKLGDAIEHPISTESNFVGLNDINLSIKKGEFIVITGSIGSGKSSLLNAFAGFMTSSAGTVDANGSLVFCGAPWVQNSTVRDNILFGSDYDKVTYDKVVYACSLEADLYNLPAADFTEVGEKGVTLSGGQKARINLARAVYSGTDIILMDDVLSAVDARVGKNILNHCFLDFLKDKTRVLATHQLSLIDNADRIVFLNGDGSIQVGTMEELNQTNKAFKNLMTFSKTSEEPRDDDDVPLYSETEEKLLRSKTSNTIDDEELDYIEYTRDKDLTKGQIVTDEERAVNAIKSEVYLNYIKHGTGRLTFVGFLIFFGFLMTCSTFCDIFSNTWLSYWISRKFPDKSDGFYIGIYVMLNIMWVVFLCTQFVVLVTVTTNSSKNLNIKAMKRVLYAPMSFMDINPIGRVLNRFTKDTDALDNEISEQIRLFTNAIARMIGILILMIIYLPWVALCIPLVAFLFTSVASYYQASSRETKRIEAVKRSLVYNNFNESLSGMSTIKTFKSELRFINRSNKLLNEMNEASLLFFGQQRWLAIQLEVIASIIVLVVALLCVNHVFHINPATVGLLLAYCVQLAGELASLIRTFTQIENDMNSVERVCHYAIKLPQEADYVIEATEPEKSWPSQGEIEFDKVSFAYRDGLPLVLKGLSFKVSPGEKIGICGRTGAGKSSIMTALYRLNELESGKIKIDGIDISTIGLRSLRANLSIIPQDPILFNSNIRKNLDPFGEHEDDVLWDALRRSGAIQEDEITKVKLQTKDNEEFHKFHLDQTVDDEGANFSLGERQLIAFARALVRDTKILILDEATSSVDYETDSKIQKTISTEFSDCTILCIAHRLKTILKYDRIMTLDHGEIKEFDTPLNLFNSDGIFSQMCEKSNIGKADFD